MTRPTTPDSHVVRRFASDKTHVMVVESVDSARVFGQAYWRPRLGRAACGVMIDDGVVMRPGVITKCSACKHVTGITEEGPWDSSTRSS